VPVRIHAPAKATGLHPAVVFSHGGGESREAYGYLGEHLARHGYAVVFLTHVGSDRAAVDARGLRGLGGLDDRRPRDVLFVLDRLLSADPDRRSCATVSTAIASPSRVSAPGRRP
jgi:predicted dienelactone hydrolase